MRIFSEPETKVCIAICDPCFAPGKCQRFPFNFYFDCIFLETLMLVNVKRYALKGPRFEEDISTWKWLGFAKDTEKEQGFWLSDLMFTSFWIDSRHFICGSEHTNIVVFEIWSCSLVFIKRWWGHATHRWREWYKFIKMARSVRGCFEKGQLWHVD